MNDLLATALPAAKEGNCGEDYVISLEDWCASLKSQPASSPEVRDSLDGTTAPGFWNFLGIA